MSLRCVPTRSVQLFVKTINASTVISIPTTYAWDEAKRQSNLEKHGLDLVDADLVLTSEFRLEVATIRNGEHRRLDFAYVFEVLTVLTVVYLPGEQQRIISFRPAQRSERTAYHEWLENDFDDA